MDTLRETLKPVTFRIYELPDAINWVEWGREVNAGYTLNVQGAVGMIDPWYSTFRVTKERLLEKVTESLDKNRNKPIGEIIEKIHTSTNLDTSSVFINIPHLERTEVQNAIDDLNKHETPRFNVFNSPVRADTPVVSQEKLTVEIFPERQRGTRIRESVPTIYFPSYMGRFMIERQSLLDIGVNVDTISDNLNTMLSADIIEQFTGVNPIYLIDYVSLTLFSSIIELLLEKVNLLENAMGRTGRLLDNPADWSSDFQVNLLENVMGRTGNLLDNPADLLSAFRAKQEHRAAQEALSRARDEKCAAAALERLRKAVRNLIRLKIIGKNNTSSTSMPYIPYVKSISLKTFIEKSILGNNFSTAIRTLRDKGDLDDYIKSKILKPLTEHLNNKKRDIDENLRELNENIKPINYNRIQNTADNKAETDKILTYMLLENKRYIQSSFKVPPSTEMAKTLLFEKYKDNIKTDVSAEPNEKRILDNIIDGMNIIPIDMHLYMDPDWYDTIYNLGPAKINRSLPWARIASSVSFNECLTQDISEPRELQLLMLIGSSGGLLKKAMENYVKYIYYISKYNTKEPLPIFFIPYQAEETGRMDREDIFIKTHDMILYSHSLPPPEDLVAPCPSESNKIAWRAEDIGL